jgi:23S rRNA (pseudouridine1915-N3)-methyltransferase
LKIRVVAVGRTMPGWVEQGWNEYARRLPRQLEIGLDAIAPSRARGEAGAREEGEALLRRCPRDSVRIALDGGGAAWTTPDFAGRLEQWMMDGRPVALLIGGADGHVPATLSRCDAAWSLGPLTLPHMLVRVVVAEQLYRAWTLVSGHPYHRQ